MAFQLIKFVSPPPSPPPALKYWWGFWITFNCRQGWRDWRGGWYWNLLCVLTLTHSPNVESLLQIFPECEVGNTPSRTVRVVHVLALLQHLKVARMENISGWFYIWKYFIFIGSRKKNMIDKIFHNLNMIVSWRLYKSVLTRYDKPILQLHRR